MSISVISDHLARTLELFTEQFKNSPNYTAVISAVVPQIQELETMFQALITDVTLDNAAGIQLDRLGEIVNEKRKGRSDEDYRAALRIKIQINIASGAPEEVITVAKALTEATNVRLTEKFPAAIHIDSDGLTFDANIANEIGKIVAATISLSITLYSSNPFVFAGDPDGGGYSGDGFPNGGEYSVTYQT